MKKILLMALLCLPLMSVAGAHKDNKGPGYSGNGPPSHAPAHGYRHKHGKHDLAFDERLGVYEVLNRPDNYFWDNLFYRFSNGQWQFSEDLDGRWQRDDGRMPSRLYQRNDKQSDNKGRGKD